jgi:hypothetical protein
LFHGLWSSSLLTKRFTITLLLFSVTRVIASPTGSRTTCIQFYEHLLISYILFTHQFHFLSSQLLSFFLPSQLRTQLYLLRLFFDFVLLSAHTFFLLSFSSFPISVHLCSGIVGQTGSLFSVLCVEFSGHS